MEVACGEHGDFVQILVVAVNAGKCNKFATPEHSSNKKIISNDIAKETNPMKTVDGTISVPNGSVKTPSSQATCTTSLLDSSENLSPSDNGKINVFFPLFSQEAPIDLIDINNVVTI